MIGPPSSRCMAERLTKRDALILVGLEEFLEHGFSATGVEAITRRAGVARGSFYGHFASKEAFAVEVVEAHCEMNRQVATIPGPAGDRLPASFARLGDAAEAGGFLRGCLWGNLAVEASVSPIVRRVVASGIND